MESAGILKNNVSMRYITGIFLVLGFNAVLSIPNTFDSATTYSINESQIYYCCQHPKGHSNIMDACANETGFKLPSANEDSMVDISTDVISATCFGSCVFTKLNFMRSGELDMDMVRKYYTAPSKTDPEYGKEMVEAFDHCHGKSESDAAKFLSSKVSKNISNKFCDPKPSVIWACVLRQFFHSCPDERWNNSKECSDAREFIRDVGMPLQ